MNKKLIILRGPSATGKSTIAQRYRTMGYIHVNKDTIRADNPTFSEREVHETVMALMDNADLQGQNIVNDNVNFSQKTVNRYTSWADRHGYEWEIINTGRDVLFEVAVMRDYARGSLGGRSVGRSVIATQYIDFGYFKPYHNPTVIFDIDGTIADIAHRRHHVASDRKDWQLFFSTMKDDTPNQPVVETLNLYCAAKYNIILSSGRPANYRAVTEAWLNKHDIPYDFLFMRKFNDTRPDTIIKQEMYNTYIKPYFPVKCVYDDRPSVCRMWRFNGLHVFNCGDGVEF